MKANDIFRRNGDILRILEIRNGRCLCINCNAACMPVWILMDEIEECANDVEPVIDTNMNVWQKQVAHERFTTMTCSIIIVISLILGYYSSHRSFMHSIFAICLFTSMVWIAFKPLTIAFAVGYLSHILLELTNKKGVQLLFPLKK